MSDSTGHQHHVAEPAAPPELTDVQQHLAQVAAVSPDAGAAAARQARQRVGGRR